MKNIFVSLLFLTVFLLTGCETIDSIGPKKPIKQTSPDTFRSTNSGPIIGFEGNEDIHTWLGIPFAEPPENQRFSDLAKKNAVVRFEKLFQPSMEFPLVFG